MTHQVRTYGRQLRRKSELEENDMGVQGRAKRKGEITGKERGEGGQKGSGSDPSKTLVVETCSRNLRQGQK